MIWKAFDGISHEDYIDYCRNYLTTAVNHDKDIILGDMFYKPMLELISYLKDNQYQVYIVSGSVQGVIWSIVPEKTPLKERFQLLGTRQILKPDYSNSETQFIIQKESLRPKTIMQANLKIYTLNLEYNLFLPLEIQQAILICLNMQLQIDTKVLVSC